MKKTLSLLLCAALALSDPKYFVPARVLTGFGAICFTLFPIVSILESGTENRK